MIEDVGLSNKNQEHCILINTSNKNNTNLQVYLIFHVRHQEVHFFQLPAQQQVVQLGIEPAGQLQIVQLAFR